jgi:hypothetical protein
MSSAKGTRKRIPLVVIILGILVMGGLCMLCGYLQNPPAKTEKPPDYYYSYNLSGNGSTNSVLILAEFSPILQNNVKYLDSDGDDLELKIWGKTVSTDAVHFYREGNDLTVDIRVESAIDNFLGSSRADEYVYLPRNWTYTIVSTNRNGNTTVENKSWSYSSYAAN